MSNAEQARAFRESSDEDYADALNGRMTAAELIEKNMPPDFASEGTYDPYRTQWARVSDDYEDEGEYVLQIGSGAGSTIPIIITHAEARHILVYLSTKYRSTPEV